MTVTHRPLRWSNDDSVWTMMTRRFRYLLIAIVLSLILWALIAGGLVWLIRT